VPYGEVTLVVIKEGEPRHAYVNFTNAQQAAAAAAVGTVYLQGQPSTVNRPLLHILRACPIGRCVA
jgi:hypothetical protein